MIDSQLHWHRKRSEADGTEDYDGARVSRLGLQLMGTEHPASATPQHPRKDPSRHNRP